MKFAVVAAGGVGGFFGGRLARAGADVTFFARGAHLAAIRERGLKVKGAQETFTIRPVKVTDDFQSVGPVDVVLVTVKTWQLPEIAAKLTPMVGPATLVLPLLNGVEASPQLAQLLGPERVLGGLCNVISWVAKPGTIESLGTAAGMTFGVLPGGSAVSLEPLRTTLASAGINAQVAEDIVAAQWRKFAFITAFGGVGAVTRAPAGVTRSVAPTRTLLERSVAEVFAVARARGVKLDHSPPDTEVAKTLAYMDTLPPDGFASMARDLFAGKRSELEAWNGAVVRLGREARVATPVQEFIYASLLPAELKGRGELPGNP